MVGAWSPPPMGMGHTPQGGVGWVPPLPPCGCGGWGLPPPSPPVGVGGLKSMIISEDY